MGFLNTDVIGNSGELLTVQSPVEAPAASLKVHFSSKQEGEGTPSPENVRPISGWTGCEVYRMGKNLIDLSVPYQNPSNTALVNTTRRVFTPYTYSYGASYSNWWQPHQVASCSIEGDKLRVVTKNTAYGVGFAIPVKAGWTLRLSYHSTGRTHIAYYDRWGKYISGGPTDTVNLSVPNQAVIGLIIFESYPSGAEVVFSDIMLTVQTAALYEPCHGNTLSVDWAAEIGTVYGGYVDLVRGLVVEEWHSVSINKDTAMRNFTPDKRNQGQGCEASYWLSTFNAPNAKGYIPYSRDGYCDKLQYYENAYNYDSAAAASNSTVDIRLAGVRPLEDYLSWLEKNGPIKVVYKLATPIEHPIPSTTLSILRGINYIWADGDSVDISYRCAETRDMILTRRQTVLAQPHISDWVTGTPIATYTGDMLATMKNCRVFFDPVQEGTGTPSPDNVRAITGWSRIEVNNSGHNIWDEEWEGGYLNTSTGVNAVSKEQIRAKNYIPILGNTTYRLLLKGTGTIWAILFDKDRNVISDWDAPSGASRSANVYALSNKVFTTPANAAYMRFYFTSIYGMAYNHNVSLLYPSTLESYEPYSGQSFTIPLPSEFYGGYVDPVKGEIVEEWSLVTNSSQVLIVDNPIYMGEVSTRWYFMIPTRDRTRHAMVDCAAYASSGSDINADGKHGIWAYDGSGLMTLRTLNTLVGIDPADDRVTRIGKIREYISVHPVKACIPLAAPVHHSIDTQRVESLRGINNVWSNAGGKIELRYWTHKRKERQS